MSDYEICKTGQGYLVNRDGVRLGVFSEKKLADEFVSAHRTFKKSVSGKYDPVLSKEDAREQI